MKRSETYIFWFTILYLNTHKRVENFDISGNLHSTFNVLILIDNYPSPTPISLNRVTRIYQLGLR